MAPKKKPAAAAGLAEHEGSGDMLTGCDGGCFVHGCLTFRFVESSDVQHRGSQIPRCCPIHGTNASNSVLCAALAIPEAGAPVAGWRFKRIPTTHLSLASCVRVVSDEKGAADIARWSEESSAVMISSVLLTSKLSADVGAGQLLDASSWHPARFDKR